MKCMNARIVLVVALMAGAAVKAEDIMVVNDSKKDLKVVAAHKIFDRAIIIKPGQKAAIKIDGFLSKMGAGKKLKFHQDGIKTYVMDVRFAAGKEETIRYSQVQSGHVKLQLNPTTNQKEMRFVITPVGKEEKKTNKKAAPKKEKKEKVKKEQKPQKEKKEKVKKQKPAKTDKKVEDAAKKTRREKMYKKDAAA